VRGEDGSWVYAGDGSQKGKQGHMASAVEELCARSPSLVITRGSTVLIDDDRSNIEVALKAGVRAFWLDPRRPEEVVESLLGGMGASSLPPSLPPSFLEEEG
jgi:DNA-binding NarL/FixJ family response regulator